MGFLRKYVLPAVTSLLISCGFGESTKLEPIPTYRNGNLVVQRVGDTDYVLIRDISEESLLNIYPEKVEKDQKHRELLKTKGQLKKWEEIQGYTPNLVVIDDVLKEGIEEIQFKFTNEEGEFRIKVRFTRYAAQRSGDIETYEQREREVRSIIGNTLEHALVDDFELESLGVRDPRTIPEVRTYESGNILMQTCDGVIYVLVREFESLLPESIRKDRVFLIDKETVGSVSTMFVDGIPRPGAVRWKKKEPVGKMYVVIANDELEFERKINLMDMAVGAERLREVREGGVTTIETRPLDENFWRIRDSYQRRE